MDGRTSRGPEDLERLRGEPVEGVEDVTSPGGSVLVPEGEAAVDRRADAAAHARELEPPRTPGGDPDPSAR